MKRSLEIIFRIGGKELTIQEISINVDPVIERWRQLTVSQIIDKMRRGGGAGGRTIEELALEYFNK